MQISNENFDKPMCNYISTTLKAKSSTFSRMVINHRKILVHVFGALSSIYSPGQSLIIRVWSVVKYEHVTIMEEKGS